MDPGALVAGAYRVRGFLGRGGVGEVYRAESLATGREVALKLPRRDARTSSPNEVAARQARAAKLINSDRIVHVYDLETDLEWGQVLVLELLRGETLIDQLRREGLQSAGALFPIVAELWRALADVHAVGIVHRNVKPSNVFLTQARPGVQRSRPKVKLLDLCMARLPSDDLGARPSQLGTSLGAFSFMPPEAFSRMSHATAAFDIYGVCTLIYQALSGQLPFAAKNVLQMVDLKTKTEPRPLRAVCANALDPRLDAFVMCGISRDPAHRFPTAGAALEAWEQLELVG